MKTEVNWIIHLVANGADCAECGTVEDNFLPYACNAHTHGMELYNHQDFQFVLSLEPQMIMYILNSLGLRVQSGERFKAGDLVSKIIEGYDILLEEFDENDRKVLRAIIPDANGLFPDNSNCDEIYRMQALNTNALNKNQSGLS